MLARKLEENDIITVTLNMFLEVANLVQAPRTINTNFVFGAPFGDPGNTGLQLKVIKESLMSIKEIDEPGTIIELPYKWRQKVKLD
ncbi:hypothetical protein [Selenihalanaerobacter shriftii]|uniref:hypothetical protein n=1 Tax=Selenihalanaerobacter shriftii TaxID=142842 RepID=UPI00117B8FC2|nr:hypothetical protein [Selenihalanaerobacter shriftii]